MTVSFGHDGKFRSRAAESWRAPNLRVLARDHPQFAGEFRDNLDLRNNAKMVAKYVAACH